MVKTQESETVRAQLHLATHRRSLVTNTQPYKTCVYACLLTAKHQRFKGILIVNVEYEIDINVRETRLLFMIKRSGHGATLVLFPMGRQDINNTRILAMVFSGEG